MGTWSELPSDILLLISLKIDNPFNLVHFRSICSSWRSSSIVKFQQTASIKCPLPLDPGGCGDDCHILSHRTYLIKSSNSPSLQYWLFNLHEKENGEIVVSNLLYRSNSSKYGCLYSSPCVELLNCPSVDLLNCQIFETAKAYVAYYSSWNELFDVLDLESPVGFMALDSTNNKFLLLGKPISFDDLAMYRSIDERWTELMAEPALTELKVNPFSSYEAIVSYKGKFYAIDYLEGTTIVVEPNLQVNTFQRSRPSDKTKRRWLVKSGDNLLLIELCNEDINYYCRPNISENKVWLEISKLNEKRNDWDQVEDMDGHVLFLDHYCSFSCLANEIPGFKANSVIFLQMLGQQNVLFEFDGQGVRSITISDTPECDELFLFPPGWVLSTG